MKTKLFVVAFALIVMGIAAQAEVRGFEEWDWNFQHLLLRTSVQGTCPNLLGTTGPFLQCSDNFEYTTPDHRFTLKIAWSGYSLAGPGGWDNVTITVTNNTGEAGIMGFNPVEYFSMQGPAQPLSAFGFATGNCSGVLGDGAEVAYVLNLNGGDTTPGDNFGPCPQFVSYAPPTLKRPWRQPSVFDPQFDFLFPPGSQAGSEISINLIAAFSTFF